MADGRYLPTWPTGPVFQADVVTIFGMRVESMHLMCGVRATCHFDNQLARMCGQADCPVK